VITAAGVGPFNKKTEATEPALAALVPKLRVATNDLGGESGVVYDVFDGPERLFYVVPDDAPGWTDDSGTPHRYAPTMFAIFAVSSRVHVLGHSWRVGQPFEEVGDLNACECWGNREVTACFRRGHHVRVIWEQPCDDAEAQGARAMIGKPITRIMWKREIEPVDQPNGATVGPDPMDTP